MAFGPGRNAPVAAASQHCRQKSATRAAWVRLRQGVSNRAVRLSLRALPTRFRSVSGSGAQRGVAEVWVAAVSSATVLTETWLSFRPCSTRGPEGARLSFPISPVEMLATATDSWTRLRSVAALMCICRAARGCCLGVGAGPTVCVCVHPGAYCGCAACEARRSLERGGRGRHAPQVADTAAAHRRVCVIAGLRVSGMPASTGRREQSVCFFAGGRAESRIRMPGESCRRWTSGREAESAELTFTLAAPIRCLCCATVSVPVAMRAAFCRLAKSGAWGGGGGGH